jgi:hypothetical protein
MNKAINRTTVQVANNKYKVYPKAAPLFYKKSDGSYGNIDHTFNDTTSAIGDISLMDKGVVSVGKRKGNNPHKVVGIRPDNNQHLGTQQLEFSLVNVELDGESQDFNVEDDLEIKLLPSDVMQLVKINKNFKNFKIEFDIYAKGLELKNTKYTEPTTIRDYGFNLNNLGEIEAGNNVSLNSLFIEDKSIPYIDAHIFKITNDYITTGEYSIEEEFEDSDLSSYTLDNSVYPNGSSIYYKDCIVLIAKAYNTEDVETIFTSKLCNEYGLETIFEDNKNGQYFTKNGKKVAGYFAHEQIFFMFINTKEIEDNVKDLFKRKTFDDTSYLDITLSDFKTTLNKLFDVNLKLDLDTSYYKPIGDNFEFKVSDNSFYIQKPIIFDKDYNYLNLDTTHSLKDNDDGSYRYTKYFSTNGFLCNPYNIKYIDATLACATTYSHLMYKQKPDLGNSSLQIKTSTSLSAIRNTSSGTNAVAYASGIDGITPRVGDTGVKNTGQTTTYRFTVYQDYIIFDSSGISDTISDLTLKIKGGWKGVSAGSHSDISIIILKSNMDTSTISAADWNSFTGHTSGWDDSDVTEYSAEKVVSNAYASASDLVVLEIDLNSDAKTDLKNLDTYKVGIIDYDQYYLNSLDSSYGVSSTGSRYFYSYLNNASTVSNRPFLEYTTGEAEESVVYNANFFGANF